MPSSIESVCWLFVEPSYRNALGEVIPVLYQAPRSSDNSILSTSGRVILIIMGEDDACVAAPATSRALTWSAGVSSARGVASGSGGEPAKAKASQGAGAAGDEDNDNHDGEVYGTCVDDKIRCGGEQVESPDQDGRYSPRDMTSVPRDHEAEDEVEAKVAVQIVPCRVMDSSSVKTSLRYAP